LGGDGSWTGRDHVLTLALTAYEDGLCKQCGHPLVLCRDPKYDGWFEVQKTTCYAKQAMDAHAADMRRKNAEPEYGELLYTALPD
jgi:hypothetical protein